MEIKQGVTFYGFYEIEHYRNGVLIEREVTKNKVVNTGLAEIVKLIGTGLSGGTAFGYLALGTNNTAVQATDTTLGAETSATGLARAAATVTQETTTVAGDTLKLYKQFISAHAGTVGVYEVGVFNASSSGDMASRSVLSSVKNIENTDELKVTYNLVLVSA